MAKFCPMYPVSFMNGIYYYAAYDCPQMKNSMIMSSSSPLTTGCNSPHCQNITLSKTSASSETTTSSKTTTSGKTTTSSKTQPFVGGTIYSGFPGQPCLLDGLEPIVGWTEIKGVTEHVQTDDCRFTIPQETGIPGGGEVVCARLFTARVRIAHGKFVDIKVGQEMNDHPNAVDEKEFPLDVADVNSVGEPFLFEVKYKSQLYSVLTRFRK